MSGNEVGRLKSLRGKLATLCPETDGLQAKHRIRRVLKGKTREEKIRMMLTVLENEILLFVNTHKENITKKSAKLISLVYHFHGFTSEETYQILKKENVKNYR